MEDSQIFILADYYTNWYVVPDSWMDVIDVSKRHGKEKKTIYLEFCVVILEQ